MDTKQDISPHAKDLRKGRISEPFGLYLITKCTRGKTILGIEQRTAIVKAFFLGADAGDLLLYAFVVMPDHWHALFSLGIRLPLGGSVENIGRRVNYLLKNMEHVEWQNGFHDRKIRMNESVVDIVKYIENNPVRKGFAGCPELWQWSSAFCDYHGRVNRSFLGHERWA